MSRQANPAMIGGFVVGALVLGVITLLLLSGGQWFQQRQQHVLYFEGAAQGLQVGAPVVLLGVKVGTVKHIRLGLMQDGHTFTVPVTIEIEPAVVLASNGEQVDLGDPQTLRKLIERGLRAQLRMQSLLTGLLFVQLDFRPGVESSSRELDSDIVFAPEVIDKILATAATAPMGFPPHSTGVAVIEQVEPCENLHALFVSGSNEYRRRVGAVHSRARGLGGVIAGGHVTAGRHDYRHRRSHRRADRQAGRRRGVPALGRVDQR